MEVLKIAIVAEDEIFRILSDTAGIEWIRSHSLTSLLEEKNVQAGIFLGKEEEITPGLQNTLPLIINSVSATLTALNFSGPVCRINAWPGFIERKTWEVAGTDHPVIISLFERLGKETIWVADEPGLVSARILSMIINEAYFAMEEKVSSREEIDIAMQLGTNYPMGPFQWSQKIGLINVYSLLEKLSQSDHKYQPSELLKQEALNN